METDVDVWNYKGLKKSNAKCISTPEIPSKKRKSDDITFERSPAEKTEVEKCVLLKEISTNFTSIQENHSTKQTSLLSFFAYSSTANVKNETKICSKNALDEKKAVSSGSKKCPFYKFVGETPYVVDAFSYGYVKNVQAYFLSHFHSDHYKGLTKNFSRPIYCNEITANLVKFVLKVSPNFIKILPMNEFVTLPDGTRVLLIDANHCPGSVLLLFKLKNGRHLLHTGDFRADKEKIVNLQLWNSVSIDVVYLDTTYCDPRYVFPPQSEIIEKSLDFVFDELQRSPKLLICVGTYTIGKERIFSAIANLLDCKIFVQKQKYDILQCLNDDEMKTRLTLNFRETRLHVLSMFQFSFDRLNEYLNEFGAGYDSVLALKPTGWEFTKKSKKDQLIKIYRRGNVTIAGIPYSEHSSCEELKNFIQTIRPKKVLATVNNGDAKSRQKMQNLFDSWMKPDQSKSEPSMRHWLSK